MLRRKSSPDCLMRRRGCREVAAAAFFAVRDEHDRAAAGGLQVRQSPGAPSRRAASRRAASRASICFSNAAPIELLDRLHEMRIRAGLFLFRAVAVAVDAQADVEVVRDFASRTSWSTVRAVAMRVLLPSASFIEPDRSRITSRFLRDFSGSAGAAVDARSATTLRWPRRTASIVRQSVPVAPFAVPRHPEGHRLGDRGRRRDRERGRRALAERDVHGIDVAGERQARRRDDRQRHRAGEIRLGADHGQRIRQRLRRRRPRDARASTSVVMANGATRSVHGSGSGRNGSSSCRAAYC